MLLVRGTGVGREAEERVWLGEIPTLLVSRAMLSFGLPMQYWTTFDREREREMERIHFFLKANLLFVEIRLLKELNSSNESLKIFPTNFQRHYHFLQLRHTIKTR